MSATKQRSNPGELLFRSRPHIQVGTNAATRLFFVLALFCLARTNDAEAVPEVGFPFTRSYSLEDVGVSRGVQLSFDPIGRLAAIDRNKYVILNDSTWINLLEDTQLSRTYTKSTIDASGNTYFGGFASWGLLERSDDGLLERISVRPDEVPAWVDQTSFNFLLPHGQSIVFAGINGIVYWDKVAHTHQFLEVPDLLQLFGLGEKVYISSHRLGICEIDLDRMRLLPLQPDSAEPVILFSSAEIGAGKAIISTTSNEFALFDGYKLKEWENDLGVKQSTQISNLLSLPDGNIAASIDNRGLFVLTRSGECLHAFTTPEYHRITQMASNEAGVLWIVTESDIQKSSTATPSLCSTNDPASP